MFPAPATTGGVWTGTRCSQPEITSVRVLPVHWMIQRSSRWKRPSTVSGLPISRHVPSMRLCLMKRNIFAHGGPCTALWAVTGRFVSAGTSCVTLDMRSRSWWRLGRINYGAGILPGFMGPSKGVNYHLYVLIDVYSRYITGWMIADRESADLATRFIEETCIKQQINPGQLTVLADRGSSMMSKPPALLMEDLGIRKSHSRPRVSNDNPFSESQFKTMKYRPDYPSHFGSLQDDWAWANSFFTWYNSQHYHRGIGLLSPGPTPLREGGISTDQASASFGRSLRCQT